MTLFPFLQPSWKAVVGIITLVITILSWQRPPFHLGLFGTIYLGIMITDIPYSQMLFTLVISTYLLVISLMPGLKNGLSFFRWGMFDRDVKFMCFGAVSVSGLVLSVWFFWMRPDINDIICRFIPDYPMWILIIGGVLFALINAAVEEVAYRGIILGALTQSQVPDSLALCLQAIAFGAIHINGFPCGWIGVGLATIYGFIMGIIRLKSGGLFAPWAGHVLTDIVVVVIVFSVARPI